MEQVLAIAAKYQVLCGRLDEATLRLWAATEARSLGRGGVTLVAKATGLSRTTIHVGLSELNAPVSAGEQGVKLRARAVGGGRKKLIDKDASLLAMSTPWWNRQHVVIRCRRCAGPARAPIAWLKN